LPEQCTTEDIVTMINFVIENIPLSIKKKLPFKLNDIDSTYVKIIHEIYTAKP
jgi:hypothetical protein